MPQVRSQFGSAIAQLEENDWPYPLVLVNDQPTMAGHIDAYALLDILREELGDN